MEDVEYLVQEQIKAFNLHNMDLWLSYYDDNASFYSFPNQMLFNGKENIKKIYTEQWNKYPEIKINVGNRIIFENYVIDLETLNGIDSNKYIAINKIIDNKIKSVHFLKSTDYHKHFNTETVINKQIDAYNNNDIDAYISFYTYDCKYISFPEHKVLIDGIDDLKDKFSKSFINKPDTKLTIERSILVNDYTANLELITGLKDKNYYMVSILQVNDKDKISNVWTINSNSNS
ncbi:MAG: hypothetical protein ACOCV8_05015 [Spirochaetota bacterium]